MKRVILGTGRSVKALFDPQSEITTILGCGKFLQGSRGDRWVLQSLFVKRFLKED